MDKFNSQNVSKAASKAPSMTASLIPSLVVSKAPSLAGSRASSRETSVSRNIYFPHTIENQNSCPVQMNGFANQKPPKNTVMK